MRLVTALLYGSVLGACSKTVDDYQVIPGQGGPNGGSNTIGVDAVTDTVPGSQISARVCLLTDPRDLTSCAPTGAANLTVKLGTVMASTVDDGSFTIATPSGSNLSWSITGAGIEASLVPYSTSLSISAIASDAYTQLRTANGVLFVDQTAAVFAHVVHAGAAVTGVTTTVSPSPTAGVIYYDGNSAQVWDQGATSTFGMIWVPEIDLTGGATAATLTVSSGGTPTGFPGVPLRNLTLTFVTIEI